jgi:hypothetical protein
VPHRHLRRSDLTPAEKMKVALDDSFDPSAFLVAGIFAGLSMAQKQYSSFGTGAQGLANITEEHLQTKQLATS